MNEFARADLAHDATDRAMTFLRRKCDELARELGTAEGFLISHGYWRCNSTECGCGSWHGGPLEPSTEDIAEAEARRESDEVARDRAERAMYDDAFSRGYAEGRRSHE